MVKDQVIEENNSVENAKSEKNSECVKSEDAKIKPLGADSEIKKIKGSRWYVAQVHSGCELSVVRTIEEKVEQAGMSNMFEQMLVPMHKVSEVKKGKRVESERKFFPRYVLIKMVMTNETWHLVRSINRVLGFLGVQGKPVPISQKEAEGMIVRFEKTEEKIISDVVYSVGEGIKVCDGPFASFNGTVEAVEDDKQRLTVSVSIFGRPTLVELEFKQVEKI